MEASARPKIRRAIARRFGEARLARVGAVRRASPPTALRLACGVGGLDPGHARALVEGLGRERAEALVGKPLPRRLDRPTGLRLGRAAPDVAKSVRKE